MSIKIKKKAEVVHCKKGYYDIYIGRGSKWGNPFKISFSRTRENVINLYRKYIMSKPSLLKDLPELEGKKLGCYCKPLACHGDVLKELVDAL